MIRPHISLSLSKPARKKYLSHRQRSGPADKVDTHSQQRNTDYRPHRSSFKHWLEGVLVYLANHPQYGPRFAAKPGYEVHIRLVDEAEMRQLAAKCNHKSNDYLTVLSFPCDLAQELSLDYVGDIVMCGKFIYNQAHELKLDFKSHWRFLFIHSVLHLLGWEHGSEMESLETEILKAYKV